jgi:hypothetical protein
MQEIFLSSAENQACYQEDEFGSKRVEDWRCSAGWKRRFGCCSGYGPGLGPCSQATADENSAFFYVLSSTIRLDNLSAESFVGIHGSLRDLRAYAELRGFFLLANARSRLRR